ncbi:MAG: hypothetical protein ACI9ON_000892 [Limisphaerales bacterium]|jgi:hypothetical protein
MKIDEQPDELEDIFGTVTARKNPSAENVAEARGRANEAWLAMVAKRKRRSLQRFSGIAATFAILGIIGLTQFSAVAPIEFELAAGVLVEESTNRTVGPSQMIELEGSTIWVAKEPTRMALNDIGDIRLSKGARAEIYSGEELRLLNGSIYIDTQGDADITILTPFGTVSDIGTRFAVTVDENQLVVGVRHGEVRVESRFGELHAKGQGSTASVVTVDDQGSRTHTEPSSAERWEWIHAVSPGYDNNTVMGAVRQIADDLGVELTFENRGVEAGVTNVAVQGDLQNLQPRQALQYVFQDSGMNYQLDAENLTISSIR